MAEQLLLGLGAGAVIASLALGLVVAYRASGVVNFAHAALGMYVAFAYFELRRTGEDDPDFGRTPTGRGLPERSRLRSGSNVEDASLPRRSPDVDGTNEVFRPPFLGAKVVKGLPIDEIAIGQDVNDDEVLEPAVTEVVVATNRRNTPAGPRNFYLGQAGASEDIEPSIYPLGTEFLHTVRYVGVDDAGRIGRRNECTGYG